MTFRALVVEEEEQGQKSASVQILEEDRLPEGEVTVAVEYSTLNYKDGLCIGPAAGWCALSPCAGHRLRRHGRGERR
jgi:acrylyl-CoA reductase (NADPH)